MRIEALRCYREAVRTGSITRAANCMFISQQGLSKVIRSLEEELGVRLFCKEGRNVVPTEEGLLLDDFAEKVIAEYEKLRRGLRDSVEAREMLLTQEVTLHATPFVCNNLFNLLENEMNDCGIGEAVLSIQELDYSEIASGFESGDVEIALVNVAEPEYEELSSFGEVVPLFASEVVVLAPPSIASSLSSRSVTAEVLSKLPVAHYNDSVLNKLIVGFCAESGIEPPRLLQHSTNNKSIRRMLSKGLAVTFGDTFSLSVGGLPDGAVPLRMKPTQRFICCFLLSSQSELNSSHRVLVKRFKEMIRVGHADFTRALSFEP